MRRLYGYKHILVLADDLQAFAWSAPMRDLAAKVGLSDVGLKKLLKSHNIVTPPQGHWNKVHAGRAVPKRPKAPPRRPGEIGRVHLDERFASVLTPVEPMSSAGPFASAAVPEDLDELHAQELKAIGRVSVPKSLERVHHGLTQIVKQEQRRREKFAASGWSWDAPKYDSAVDRWRLRILNAVFMALSRRGHAGDAYERDGKIHATAIVGDTHIGLDIDVAGKRNGPPHGASPNLPLSTPLFVELGAAGNGPQAWQDDAAGRLETRMAEIVAGVIVAGEARFRRGLREAEERAEQFRRWEEDQRQERIEARNQQRLEQLRTSGELLRQAEDLRGLILRVREAVIAGSAAVDHAALEAWEKWASAEADRLDPIRSGQIMTHLAPLKNQDH